MLTTRSASMLAEVSKRMTIWRPPRFRPVRYWRLPSPVNSRALRPVVSSADSRSRFTSSSSAWMSAFSRSRSVLSLLSCRREAINASYSLICSVTRVARPRASTICRSTSSRALRSRTSPASPSLISSSSRLTSESRSRFSSRDWTSMEWSMIRNTSTTAPKPQDMMSRKLRLKVVKPRLRLAMVVYAWVLTRISRASVPSGRRRRSPLATTSLSLAV